MNIQINDDYRIKSDAYNVIVETKSVVKEGDNVGKEYWTAVGFYPNLESAYRGMVKDGLQTKDLVGVEAILDYLRQIHADIKTALGKEQ
jgi:hypothetical protein